MITNFNQYLNENDELGLDAYNPQELAAMLIKACDTDHPDLDRVKSLIEAGADLDFEDANGRHVVTNAAANGNTDVIRMMIELGGISPNIRTSSGMTALHYAALRGKTGAIQFLLDAGASIDAQNSDGRTPLHYAAEYDHLAALEALLAAGANPNARSESGDTPLHGAACNGYTEIATALITVGADIDAQDSFGDTPLHWAAEYSHLEMIQELLDSGADKHIQNHDGKTAWDIAPHEIRRNLNELQP